MLLVMWASLSGTISLTDPPEKSMPQPEKPALPAKPPVDLSLIAERMRSGGQYLTPEQVREETELRNEQVKAAEGSLDSVDIEERIAGAEQLAAYPTPEGEKLLNKALEGDMEQEVRQAAAVSLGYVKKPKSETISLLLLSLRDPAEEVRSAALETLSRYFAHDERGANQANQIVKGLKKAAKSNRTPPDIREDIRNWLKEQSVN